MDNEQYEVEGLLGCRIYDNQEELLVKWVGYEKPTWEPRFRIVEDVPHVVRKFENLRKCLFELGADSSLRPDKVLGSKKLNGKILYLLKWKNCDEADLIPGEKLNSFAPEVVLSYYQRNLKREVVDDSFLQKLKKDVEQVNEETNKKRETLSTLNGNKRSNGSTINSNTDNVEQPKDNTNPEEALEDKLNVSEPEKIFAIINKDDKYVYVMKWKHSEEYDLQPAEIINRFFPEFVVQYHEAHSEWVTDKNSIQDDSF